MNFLNRMSDVMGKYFVWLILLVAMSAMLISEPFVFILKYRIFGQSIITLGLGVIMFVMGLTMKKEDFRVVITRPRDIMIGCIAQFTIMPLIAFLLAKTMNLPPELAVGLVLLGTCPGGTASNVMTYLAKGDVALSVGMTAVSTLLAPLLTPALTYMLAGQWIDINAYTMMIDILKIVVIPILSGMLLHHFFDRAIQRVKKILVMIPILVIVLIMGLCVAPNKTNLINSGYLLILAVCLHNWIGFLLGYTVGKFTNMNDEKKKALSIEVGLQNSGLAIGLSGQFMNPLTALPATLATVIHQISGSLLASVFSGGKFLKSQRR
ncbi:MAG: bile acid:sodium symporter family protein [Fusobacterium sp.]|uniref:bile acid:sodium symporter family protein n=1 Tax=Fusobacterium sp. TaxID=68766 RepID=UPI0026DB77AA|nr:bile acid:sodium symporter family protein [Fusobacterium sp.]MDO4690982.1 bile acid:sodium symporter family protein [Fusobacterium sp.]